MGIGVWQLVLILAIVVLLFGARKLPGVAGDVAKAIKSFKSGMSPEESKGGETATRIEGEEAGKDGVVKKDEAAQS
jgi:sec-independent protein translocase protein TatA